MLNDRIACVERSSAVVNNAIDKHVFKRIFDAPLDCDVWWNRQMIIPPEQLTEHALRSIIESFILRDGTDYGDVELALEIKVEDLLPQVIRGEVLIVFDDELQEVSLVTRHDYNQRQFFHTE